MGRGCSSKIQAMGNICEVGAGSFFLFWSVNASGEFIFKGIVMVVGLSPELESNTHKDKTWAKHAGCRGVSFWAEDFPTVGCEFSFFLEGLLQPHCQTVQLSQQ